MQLHSAPKAGLEPAVLKYFQLLFNFNQFNIQTLLVFSMKKYFKLGLTAPVQVHTVALVLVMPAFLWWNKIGVSSQSSCGKVCTVTGEFCPSSGKCTFTPTAGCLFPPTINAPCCGNCTNKDGSGTSPGTCCSLLGQNCANTSQCCDPSHDCQGNTCCLTGMTRAKCSKHGDCCKGLVCLNFQCCPGLGDPCTTGSCCPGLNCTTEGMCDVPTTTTTTTTTAAPPTS